MPAHQSKGSLFVIFTTVFMDLVGFGMVIPLIGIYAKHYGAHGWMLAAVGASYSAMQFVFAPVWGRLSDQFGRRPILLVSLAGSTVSYLLFGLAGSLWMLLASRLFAGMFAANVSAAMAYIADVTTRENRARGMALIGAAFGIGFTLGPPLGGIASARLGLAAPGLVASAICGLNFLVALVRLTESLPRELRRQAGHRSLSPIDFHHLSRAWKHELLWGLIAIFMLISYGFSSMEQPFSLLIQDRLNLDTTEAGYRAGLIFMCLGLTSGLVQGGFVRRLGPRFGEKRLLVAGLSLYVFAAPLFPYLPSYGLFFVGAVLIGIANGLVNPNLTALISRCAAADEQGTVLGLAQGFGSLGRVLGPLAGLIAFDWHSGSPFVMAGALYAGLLFFSLWLFGSARRA